jgi:predicted DCC family thiol-disulfide oxidoreductase YuxK/uncharacterized OsmC-like protein
MRIVLTSETSLRLEPAPGPMTIEAPTADRLYSPFHMLASGLAFCTFSILDSWAAQAGLATESLVVDVAWTFAERPHRVGAMCVTLGWPELPESRRAAAKRVAALCAVHATFTHPPAITIDLGGVAADAADAAGEATAAPLGPGRRFTVVYDGDCKVCTRLARVLAEWDARRELEIVPSQAPGVQARFPWIPARAYAESLQVVDRAGRTWQGAAALETIINALPKGRLLSWIFAAPFARPLAERLYRWFARNRYRLGCGEHCSYRGGTAVEYGEDG